MDIYYPKDIAVSHGKVHELLGSEALKKGEPLSEESIRWLLELHGEMYLIEQHYSTRTRTRRLALNGTPVAEFSDVEPMVDFQLGTANIRMCFTVRGSGIVYELFVNGKRFEDLTQALPSPIAARAEGSGMTFGAPLTSQRLGLLPPHLQPPSPQAPVPPPKQQQQIMALPPLDSSLSSLTQPIPPDNVLALLDNSYHSGGGHHQRHPSRRISLSLAHHNPHDGAADLFASIVAVTNTTAATTAASQALALTTAHHHHHQHILGTPETTAAAGTPTTIALSSEAGSVSQSAWADMVVMDSSPSFVMTAIHQPGGPGMLQPLASPVGLLTGREEGAAMVIGAADNATNVHGAGLLLRPSVEELYFSSDDDADLAGEGDTAMASAMVVAVPAGAGGSRTARRRRGTTAEFLIQEDEDAMDTAAAAAAAGPNRIVLPAFKVAKTSAGTRPATGGMGTQHGSMPNLLKAAAAQQQQEGQVQGQGQASKEEQQHHGQAQGHPLKRRGFDHVLAEEAMLAGAGPPTIQRSLSASDVMGRPPKLSIQVPAPPTTLNCTGLLKRGLLKSATGGGGGGGVGARGIQPPVCLPR